VRHTAETVGKSSVAPLLKRPAETHRICERSFVWDVPKAPKRRSAKTVLAKIGFHKHAKSSDFRTGLGVPREHSDVIRTLLTSATPPRHRKPASISQHQSHVHGIQSCTSESTANCIIIAQFPIENHSEQGQFAELPLKIIGKGAKFGRL
jgi:hypothetical protein